LKYFLLTSDEKNRLPRTRNLYEQIDVRQLNKQHAHKLERFTSVEVEPHIDTLYPDVLSKPLFMVSKGVAEVMSYYDSSVDFKIAALFDLENGVGTTYFIPIFDRVDCLTEGTEFSKDRGEIFHAVIDPGKTMGKAFFRLDGVKNTYVAARLDFVESLLRRKAIGLAIEEISIGSR